MRAGHGRRRERGVTEVTRATALAADARAAMDEKTKPIGALGHLESIAVRLAVLQGTLAPDVSRARVVVFAADHGVAADGVSAYPPRVTAEMMRNFARGGAAVCVLARANALEVEVVDVGVDADLAAEVDALAGAAGTRIVHAKVRRGSRNLRLEPAMTRVECDAALEVGRAAVRCAAADGVRALGLGEMGIGNTTAAAALLCALTGLRPEDAVGRGTGIDDAGLRRKRGVVHGALARHAAACAGPRAALAAVGGLELAAIAGAVLEAPRHGIAVMADGFISTVSALAAVRMAPDAARALFVAHRSTEHGHGAAIDALGERPLLSLDMRLGEGSGAALALPILRAAAAVLREMATFASAGVSRA
jgi:nicotinate-nucleotide--dimethylbenzimidazole phosphoribosyltransferase